MTVPCVFPVLCVRDAAAAAEQLQHQFGFVPDRQRGCFRLGDQVIELRQDRDAAAGHGRIDHLALAVEDVDTALAGILARGGEIDDSVTPNGPLFIPEFWAAGVCYVFLKGPEGARIELCARPGTARPGLPGQDHIGIPCTDLPAMRSFLLPLGFAEIAATTLLRPGGNVPVAFLGLGTSVIELYSPPGDTVATAAARGVWHSLAVAGVQRAGLLTGPGGLVIDLRP